MIQQDPLQFSDLHHIALSRESGKWFVVQEQPVQLTVRSAWPQAILLRSP